jgi:hypothetical protein
MAKGKLSLTGQTHLDWQLRAQRSHKESDRLVSKAVIDAHRFLHSGFKELAGLEKWKANR